MENCSRLTRTTALENDFPVVCVGGSAGGLDAYIRLLQNLPANLGVAIVIVNHITKMPTMLHEILPRYTSMPVEPAILIMTPSYPISGFGGRTIGLFGL
ncbi:MAG: chemotaxis protein CheB [Methylovulum sp.]|nr:chemotaxis protein CheB [Methylovulum sp.]